MKQDWVKIKQAIKDNRKSVSTGIYDRALYATYLYCIRSHYRGRLHMKFWNKHHAHAYTFDPPGRPYSGKLEFNTLEDQQKFIDSVRQYIVRRQGAAFNSEGWKTLSLDFDMPEAMEVIAV